MAFNANSFGMLLGDCWQHLLYCIDVSVFIILLLGILVKQKPNSWYWILVPKHFQKSLYCILSRLIQVLEMMNIQNCNEWFELDIGYHTILNHWGGNGFGFPYVPGTTLFPSHSPIFWIGMVSGHLVGHLRASMVAFNRSNDEFCASPTRDAVPTVPLPVGKRRHDMCDQCQPRQGLAPETL